MTGYMTDIEKRTLENENFRQVLFTGPHAQLVVMTLAPGEEIGAEVHGHEDQFIRVEAGEGVAIVDGEERAIGHGSAVVIPAGSRHNIINRSKTESLRLYTIYSPPHHPDGTVHATKAEAEADEHDPPH